MKLYSIQTIEIVKDFLSENHITFEYKNLSESTFEILIDSHNVQLFVENQQGVEFIIKNLDNRSNIYSSLIEIENKTNIDFVNGMLNELKIVLDKAKSIQNAINEIKYLCNKEDLYISSIKLEFK